MSDKVRIISLFILFGLSGIFAGAIVWLSPNPLPMANTQLLTACIALFSASGIGLIRMLNATASKKNGVTDSHIEGKTHHAPSLEGPDSDTLPSSRVTKTTKRRDHEQSQSM